MDKNLTLKTYLLISFAIMAGLALPLLGRAAYNQSAIVSSNEIVYDNFVSFSETITIDGKVEGDVIAVGTQVIVNGEVTGDVIVAANTLTISGQVGGSVRAIATNITIRGSIGRNATLAAANSITVTSIGSVEGSLAYLAGSVTIAGPIAGNVTGQSVSLDLNAEVKKDVQVGISGKGLMFGPQAKVGGNLQYETNEIIPLDERAVTGTIQRRDSRIDVTGFRKFAVKASWIFRITNFFGLLLIGLIMISIVPKGMTAVVRDMTKNPFVKMGWGIIFLVGIPIVAVVFAISVIGAPMAAILAVLYALGLYLGSIFTGLVIGHSLLTYIFRGRNLPLMLSLAVGLAVFTALSWLPHLEAIVGLAGMTWGLGGLVRVLTGYIRQTNRLGEQK